ncbi:uncharacterized protein LOC142239965 [Haematobia irritans]|uniref:uncharacterized protein LOC142239965 n=1 Tax=Haematobia irritans TaxID=7368 RepID=UPI003F4FB12D
MPVNTFARFIRAADAVVKFGTRVSSLKEENLDVYSLRAQVEEAKPLWEKVKERYEECLDDLQEDSDKGKVESADGKYEATYDAYIRIVSSIERKIDGLKAVHRASTPIRQADVADISARSGNVDISGNSLLLGVDHGAVHSLALPPCDIEVFDGDFQSWPTFRDLFTAVYVKNSRLSDIERLCHLLKKTSGDAREVVRRFPLTDRSFELAWRTLKETYDNLRILVSNQLKLLFDLPVLDIETSSGLKNLQRGINACISAMAVNNVPTNDWDPILIFLCVQRLPKISVTLWEHGISDKSALSSWVDMDRFLTERIQTLTCLRDLKGIDASKKTDGRKLRTHFTNAVPKSSPSRSRNSQYTSHSSRDSVDKICVLCPRQNHHLRVCPKFRNLSVNDRLTAVKRYRCCFNCLSRRHDVNNCATSRSCEKCQGRHHTLLHRDSSHSTNVATTSSMVSAARSTYSSGLIDPQPSTSSGIVSGTSARQVFHVSQNRSVLLGTAMVNIVHQGMTYPARALIDPASEASFITEKMQKLLRISITSATSAISGVNQSVSITSRGICPLSIGSPIDESVLVEATALVLPKISGNLPSFQVSRNYMSRLPGLRLADPNLFDSRPVDLLLGADVYPRIILQGVRSGILGSLIAQQTVFGWLITGSIPTSSVTVFSTTVEFMEEDGLDKTLLRFWELEDLPRRAICSPADKFCEENFKNTTYRDSDGRYVVTLPIKPELQGQVLLGHSRTSCLKQFIRGEASLLRKPETKLIYDGVIKEYLDLQHMRPVSSTSPSDQTLCYLPHHPVINPDKLTSKLRVVFNASHKTSNGKSLNDILYVGPTLQLELVYLILRWRFFKYVFNCDITQMYRQIRVNSAHTSLQRIAFRDSPQKDVQDYELQTVTFGVNCAPYLAIRTLLQLADDSEDEYPHAAHILRRCMYVDDVLTGYHDADTAVESRDQLIRVLSSAKYELRKWTSNELAILESLPVDHLVDAKLLAFVDASSSKPLGIRWNAQLDLFYFEMKPIEQKSRFTKREVLSAIPRLFDPVGWLGPVIIVAKIIMQQVWLDKIGWEESLPLQTERQWRKFVETYQDVNHVRIPRWVNYSTDCEVELHVFSDASEKAYAGVVYVRVVTPQGQIFTHLLSCKTKVAPIKSISLPRLELCGAVLASELYKSIARELDIEFRRVYCWTDSTIVRSWLRKTPSTWSTFVANRVCRIQENTGGQNWYHVRSEDNPADLGSRGVSPAELAVSTLWWHGPEWLCSASSQWDISDLTPLETDVEVRAVKTHASFFTNYEDILERFSSLDRALRVIAYIFRFYQRTHYSHASRNVYHDTTLTATELKAVRLRLAVLSQRAHYPDEYGCLMEKKPLGSRSSLLSLNPFLDEEGVMRLNGRLSRCPTLSYSERHPIIVPYNSRFARLLVKYVHDISIHGGNQLVLRLIRIEYWIPRLTSLIRSTINRCKRCLLDRKKSCTQIMAALPPERTVLTRPFTTTGVDFAGPFEIKSFIGRACKITKGYVCVFVCFSTKAIHLEATSDLSTTTFLAAFHRFISRRGCPKTIFSDNGINFVGASREVEKELRSVLKEGRDKVCSAYQFQQLSWQFIPAGAPHMGGLWEAAVKSFKTHFRKHASGFKYTFEEFSTVLSRIEACLNSRPLCPMSESSQELVALTPGHFLVGSPILAPPEQLEEESPLHLVHRFRKMKALSQQFCLRWKEEYLKCLQKRYKWKFPQRDIEVGDLVVIRDEQLPPTSWKLGRVDDVHPGSDGRVRVADVRTANGVVRRPVVKLVILTE